jgi:F0F1-type ATP synthase membrane subunit b/b'
LKTEIGTLLAEEKERLASEAEQVQKTLSAESQSLAVEISQQILRRPVGGRSIS